MNPSSKRAIILAGGKGTRLKPYTVVLPKPLMPLGEFPILEIIIRQLVFYGFNHITLAVNHQADIIRAYFGNGEKWSVKIDYSLETTSLSTMGPLSLIEDLPSDFLVMNGDILTDLDYDSFYCEHIEKNHFFTIASTERSHKSEYGVLESDSYERLVGFQEKPTNHFNVSMGIYMINRAIMDFIPKNQPYGFDNLMLELISIKKYAHIKKIKGYWLDIGRPDDYMQAIDQFEQLKELFMKPYLNRA